MLKVGRSQHVHVDKLSEFCFNVLSPLFCYKSNELFTSLWGGFNWLAKQGTNHRVYGFKEDSGIMTLFSNQL